MKHGKFILGSLCAMLMLSLVGCQVDPPNRPGSIVQDTNITKHTPALPAMAVFGNIETVKAAIAEFGKLNLPPVKIATETTHETTTVTQPENPAGAASITSGTGTSTSITVPGSYSPAKPAPPSPASRALGGLVWLGGIVLALGVVAAVCHYVFFATFGKVLPVGVCVGIAGAGVVLIVSATVLANSPWWATFLCAAAAGLVALAVGMRDNLKKMFESPAAISSVTSNVTSSTTSSTTVPPLADPAPIKIP